MGHDLKLLQVRWIKSKNKSAWDVYTLALGARGEKPPANNMDFIIHKDDIKRHPEVFHLLPVGITVSARSFLF